MRVPHHSDKEINFHSVRIHKKQNEIVQKSTFTTSLERNIERLYCKSEKLGWNFTDFSAHVMEVLVVLQHRKKAKRLTESKQRAGGTNGV